jgi:predicted PurR-regulated permease PerM
VKTQSHRSNYRNSIYDGWVAKDPFTVICGSISFFVLIIIFYIIKRRGLSMKKLLALTIVMMFALSFFSPAVYAEESDFTKVSNEVNKTNNEINEMINKAVENAEKEILNYTEALEKIENGQDIVDQKIKDIELLNEIEELKSELNNSDNTSKKNIKIKGIINEFQDGLDKSDIQIQQLNDDLNKKIDLIISNLISEINKIAAQTIEKAAAYGFTVNYQLVEVEIGGQNIYIDPLIIGGF